MSNSANNSHISKGAFGEKVALDFLVKNGYNIILVNYRCMYGEIDIICQKDDVTAFVEVKYRTSLRFGNPREAVNLKKQQKIKTTAIHYITEQNISNTSFRFDVIEILNLGALEITHIENAFI